MVADPAGAPLPPFGRTLRHAAIAAADFVPAEPVVTPCALRQAWNFANAGLVELPRAPPCPLAPPKPPAGRRLAHAVKAFCSAGDGVGRAPPPAPGWPPPPPPPKPPPCGGAGAPCCVRQFRKAAKLAELAAVPGVVVVVDDVVDDVGGAADELEPQAARTTAQRTPSAVASSATPIRRRLVAFCARRSFQFLLSQ